MWSSQIREMLLLIDCSVEQLAKEIIYKGGASKSLDRQVAKIKKDLNSLSTKVKRLKGENK